MALIDRRIIFRAALAAVLISSLALAGCGRKGALEPPPGAAVGENGDGPQKGNENKPNRPLPIDFLI